MAGWQPDFEVSPDLRRRYLVAVGPGMINRVQRLAPIRGLGIESLVNPLHELEAEAAWPLTGISQISRYGGSFPNCRRPNIFNYVFISRRLQIPH